MKNEKVKLSRRAVGFKTLFPSGRVDGGSVVAAVIYERLAPLVKGEECTATIEYGNPVVICLSGTMESVIVKSVLRAISGKLFEAERAEMEQDK